MQPPCSSHEFVLHYRHSTLFALFPLPLLGQIISYERRESLNSKGIHRTLGLEATRIKKKIDIIRFHPPVGSFETNSRVIFIPNVSLPKLIFTCRNNNSRGYTRTYVFPLRRIHPPSKLRHFPSRSRVCTYE